jgi:hypothetical protein
MPSTNIQSLNYSDDQNQIIGKLNNNFDEIIELHGGVQGNIGPTGGDGPIGSVGSAGEPGLSGERGTRWFVRNSSPGGTGTYAVEGDYWVEISTSKIYIFTETGWVDTGYSLSTQSELFTDITYTSLGGSAGTAIIQDQTSPSLYTMVIADESPETISLLNPNLSKFVISTDNSINDAPLLEFSKSDLEDGSISDISGHPKIYWGNFSPTNKDIVIEVPGGSFNIGGSGGVEVSSVNTLLESSTGITFDNLDYINATGGININSPSGNLEILSTNMDIGATFSNLKEGLHLYPTLISSTPSINVNSGSTRGLKTIRLSDFFDSLSHSIYNVNLESKGPTGIVESRFYINTKGKIKTNKVDGGITYPSSIPGATSAPAGNLIYWYLFARPSTPLPASSFDYEPFPLEDGNIAVISPYTSFNQSPSSSSRIGIGVYSDLDYSWGSTGGLENGQSIRVTAYCSNDTSSVPSAQGFSYIGYGKKPSTGMTTVANLPFLASSVDFIISRGATGSGTSVNYLAYGTSGGSGGSFYF